jgi:peptidoglycan hydrolase-like protein with peptidoglycan-binding domain
VMGPRTSAAVRDYQTKQGLTASGQLDDATMDKLGVRGASSASPTTEPQTTAPGAQKSKQTP